MFDNLPLISYSGTLDFLKLLVPRKNKLYVHHRWTDFIWLQEERRLIPGLTRKASHSLSCRETTSCFEIEKPDFYSGCVKICSSQNQILKPLWWGKELIASVVLKWVYDYWHFWDGTSLRIWTLVLYQGKVIVHWRALPSWYITLKRNLRGVWRWKGKTQKMRACGEKSYAVYSLEEKM